MKPVSQLLDVRNYTKGSVHRKAWEIGKAMEVMQAYGVLGNPEADVLGVGAGVENTGFEIANHVKWVFMTDLYYAPGVWVGAAPQNMLTDPGAYAPEGTNALRVIPMHMDGRNLRFPDNTFDAIFSSGSIEHFGTWDDIAQAAAEIGRVLKPGGVASLSTEYKLSGDGDGFHNVKLFDMDRIYEWIVKPSGLTLVIDPEDEDGFAVSAATLATSWPLASIVLQGDWPPVEGVLEANGFQFTSVHLVLLKPVEA